MEKIMLPDYPTKVCHMCGKTFDLWDHQEDFCFDHHIGYGSAHDFEHLHLNLCCRCFDKVVDWLLPQCKHNPISEDLKTKQLTPADSEYEEVKK